MMMKYRDTMHQYMNHEKLQMSMYRFSISDRSHHPHSVKVLRGDRLVRDLQAQLSVIPR